MNFKYFLSAKNSRQLARGRLLSWQIWFQQFDFDVEWIPGNSNFLVDSLTRDMNKAFVTALGSFFIIPGKGPQDDNFSIQASRKPCESFDRRNQENCGFKSEEESVDSKMQSMEVYKCWYVFRPRC